MFLFLLRLAVEQQAAVLHQSVAGIIIATRPVQIHQAVSGTLRESSQRDGYLAGAMKRVAGVIIVRQHAKHLAALGTQAATTVSKRVAGNIAPMQPVLAAIVHGILLVTVTRKTVGTLKTGQAVNRRTQNMD